MNPDYDTYKYIHFTLLTSFQSTYLLPSALATLCSRSTLPVTSTHSRVFTEWLKFLAGPSRGAHWGGEHVSSTIFLVAV